MSRYWKCFPMALLFLGLLLQAGVRPCPADESRFHFRVELAKLLPRQTVSGRLLVYLSKRRGEPRMGPNWFRPEPFYGKDVKNVQPGQVLTLGDKADGFPGKLSELQPGRYRVQALLDHDFYSPHAGRGVGNYYSLVVDVEIDPSKPEPLELKLTEVVSQVPFPETTTIKEVTIKSELLSDFHQREVIERGAVVLPASYDSSPERRYPVVYVISGFGPTLNQMARFGNRFTGHGDGLEFIHVLLSGECKWGHHVYANSATNGPRGDCLVKEIIPTIDKTFRTVADPSARFVSGHSSGGWSSLWLQVTYPKFFGGVWSAAPDPVDFRDFQQTNLYAARPESVYSFAGGKRKPLARRGETPILWYDSFGRMDDTIGQGGQLRSFEAAFSPLDKDRMPAKLWDRSQGRIDSKVAEHWKKYDIGLILRENWQELAPLLKGKLHVTMGSLDSFYLNGATELLARDLKELGSDAEIELVPGEGHSFSRRTAERIQTKQYRQMSQIFLASFQTNGQPKDP